MVSAHIANTGVVPTLVSVDDGYSTEQGRAEVQELGVEVLSISGAKGKKLIETAQWKSQPYRQARAERSAIESLVFTLKHGFEFGTLMRRRQENVLAEMLEKILAYNICQMIRVRQRWQKQRSLSRLKLGYGRKRKSRENPSSDRTQRP